MATEPQQSIVPPTQQRGGTAPDEQEIARKGEWASHAEQGIVPAEQGGSDAPQEMLGDDPQLGGAVLGQTTGSEEPATQDGIDPSAGDNADATTFDGPDATTPGGIDTSAFSGADNTTPDREEETFEPPQESAAMQAVRDYTASKAA